MTSTTTFTTTLTTTFTTTFTTSKQMLRWFGLTALMALLAPACGPDLADDLGATPAQAPRPLGSADGVGDGADSACQLVLRSVNRIKSGPGYATTCSLGINTASSCLYVWEGQIDVAAKAAASSAAVELLYRTGQTGGQWYAVKAQPSGVATAGAGFVRYTFRIAEHTPAAGMSMTSLNKTVIELIPYIKSTAGGRLFDHNRVSNPFGSYRLDLANSWSVGPTTTVCPAAPPTQTVPRYVLDFPGFHETLVNGPAVAGGKLRIEYDGRRLRETQLCMGAKGPVSATTLKVGYRFNGGGQVKSAEVERYVVSTGYACQGSQPCITHEVKSPLLDLPASVTSIQLWFYCVPGFSSGSPGNWKYDSNMGHNYELPLVAAAKRPIDWAGSWRLHASRSGFSFPLPQNHSYTGFTNMGWSIQAELCVKGLTDKAQAKSPLLKAYVESDMHTCTPGGALKKVALPLAASGAGSYHNNALYRWGFEGLINNCPKGTYRYRFLFSADGGQSVTPLGAAASTADAGAAGFRTIVFK